MIMQDTNTRGARGAPALNELPGDTALATNMTTAGSAGTEGTFDDAANDLAGANAT